MRLPPLCASSATRHRHCSNTPERHDSYAIDECDISGTLHTTISHDYSKNIPVTSHNNVVVRCHSFCGDQGFCCCSNHTPSSCEAAGVLQRPAQEKLKETSSRTQHPLCKPRGPCPKRVKLQHWDGQGGHLSDVAAFCFPVTAAAL